MRTLNAMVLTDCTAYEITEIIKLFKNKATSDTALKFINEDIAPLISVFIAKAFPFSNLSLN